jgi:hypothetical protein
MLGKTRKIPDDDLPALQRGSLDAWKRGCGITGMVQVRAIEGFDRIIAKGSSRGEEW